MNDEKNPAVKTLAPLWDELYVCKLERKHILRMLRTHSYNLPTYIDGLEKLVRIKREYILILNKHRLLYEYLSDSTATELQSTRDILLAIAQYRCYTIALISLTAEARSIIGLPITLPSFQVCAMGKGNWLQTIRSMYVFTLERIVTYLSKLNAEDPAKPRAQTPADIRNKILNWVVDLLDVQNKSEGSKRLRRHMEKVFPLAPDGTFMPVMMFEPEIAFLGSQPYIDINLRMIFGVPFDTVPHPDDVIVELQNYITKQMLNETYYCDISVRTMSPDEAFNYTLEEAQRMHSACNMVDQLAVYKQAPVLLPIQRDTKKRETYSISVHRMEKII